MKTRLVSALPPDRRTSTRLALQVGIDVELPSADCHGEPLRRLVEA